MTKVNARFWVYWNGWVKLTLEPDQECHFGERHETDEGWSAEYQSYRYDADDMVVRCYILTDGVDCDGRLSNTWESYCPVSNLAGDPEATNEDGWRPARPLWQRESCSQRDYEAERAGY